MVCELLLFRFANYGWPKQKTAIDEFLVELIDSEWEGAAKIPTNHTWEVKLR
jgi:hypothetical protein